MATVKELRAQAKARKIPKYYKLSKPQLMSALGVTSKGDDRARSTAKQHGIAKTYAADKLSSKLGGSDEAKRVAIKQRIVKSVSKELKAHAKKIGRKLTIEEKRSVAVKALSKEVKAIRSGMPEQGGKAKQPTPDTAKMYAYRDRYLAKKAEKEKAEKTPKHGGALASMGGQITQSQQAEKKGKKSKPSANPKPQDAIDQKYGSANPSDEDVKNWRHETAIANSHPNDASVHANTTTAMQKGFGVHPDSVSKPSAKIKAIHDKGSWAEAVYSKEQKLKEERGTLTAKDFDMTSREYQAKADAAQKKLDSPRTKDKEKAKRDVDKFTQQLKESRESSEEAARRHNERLNKPKKERISELHGLYNEEFAKNQAEQTKLHEAVKKGESKAISRAVGRTMMHPDGKEPRTLRAHREMTGMNEDEAVRQHLTHSFAKNGGDSKALGLKPGADFTVAELKNAYRSSSLKAHPDRGGSSEKFHALKASYDRMLPKAKSPALDKVAEQTGMTREEVAKAVKRRTAKAPKATESKAKESGLDFLHSPETAVTAGETVHGTGINEGVRHSLILKQPKEHGGDILNWKASTKIGLPATAVSRINNLPGHSKEWSSYSGKQKAEQLEDSLNHLSVLQGKFDPKLIKDPQLHEKYKAASEHIASSMFDRMSEKEKHDWADSMHDRSQRFGSVTKSPIVQRIQTEMNGRADKIEEKHHADRRAAKKASAGKKPPKDDLFG